MDLVLGGTSGRVAVPASLGLKGLVLTNVRVQRQPVRDRVRRGHHFSSQPALGPLVCILAMDDGEDPHLGTRHLEDHPVVTHAQLPIAA